MGKYQITPLNIFSYCQAHVFILLHQCGLLPRFIIEQIEYRQSQCLDCMQAGYCMSCGCKTPAKMYQLPACKSGRWGKFLSKKKWESFLQGEK